MKTPALVEVIRYVHPGGEYHPSDRSPAHEICDADFKAMETKIGRLVAEK